MGLQHKSQDPNKETKLYLFIYYKCCVCSSLIWWVLIFLFNFLYFVINIIKIGPHQKRGIEKTLGSMTQFPHEKP